MILYDLIFCLFLMLYFPYFILKRKYHRGFIQRFGIFPKDFFKKIRNKKIIWIHAVSVGEVNAVIPLWKALRRKSPQYRIVFSTVTKTGNYLAKKIATDEEMVIYFPLDFSFIVRWFLKIINPSILIILETEIWPNFILQANKNKIPTIIVNARISDKAYRRYRLTKLFLKSVFKKISLILTQSKEERTRFISLGADEEKVLVTGNMKFDIEFAEVKKDFLDYRNKMGVKNNELLFVAGSTHRDEEKIILSVYKELISQFPFLKLLLAPRHPERTPEIERLIVKNGFSPIRISYLENTDVQLEQKTIFILDTIGQLCNFYALADIVFVGGSIVKRGGHNIIEPALFSKPIISGKYYFNFYDIFKLFLENNAVFICENKEGLKEVLAKLINSPEERRLRGMYAREIMVKERGATARNLEFISDILTKNKNQFCPLSK